MSVETSAQPSSAVKKLELESVVGPCVSAFVCESVCVQVYVCTRESARKRVCVTVCVCKQSQAAVPVLHGCIWVFPVGRPSTALSGHELNIPLWPPHPHPPISALAGALKARQTLDPARSERTRVGQGEDASGDGGQAGKGFMFDALHSRRDISGQDRWTTVEWNVSVCLFWYTVVLLDQGICD